MKGAYLFPILGAARTKSDTIHINVSQPCARHAVHDQIEMQSKKEDPNRPKKMTVGNTFKYIYSNNGISGLYRGVTPRIGLGVWQTVCMVALGDV